MGLGRQHGIGVGGYCLTKDPLLASWSRQNLFKGDEELGQSIKGVMINDKMPLYAFEYMKRELGDYKMKGKKALLLGVSYRSNVGDTRYSPVEPFYNYLINEGVKIQLHDPYVRLWDELNIEVENNIQKVFESDFNIIAVTTAHQEYKDSDCLLNLLLNQDDLFILDTVGLFSNSEIKRLRKKHKIRVVGRGDII